MRKARRTSVMVRLVALLVITLTFTMCFVSGTFAKYVSSATGSDTGRVALWKIEVNDADISSSEANTYTFNLFHTIKDTAGAAENDVKKDTEDYNKIIAPGTSGEFVIKIENLSEVTAQYAIDYTVTNDKSIPILFSVDGTNWSDTLADVTASDSTKLEMDSGTKSITVQWKWEYEKTGEGNPAASDAADTVLGIAGSATLTVTAAVTVTQVD